MKGETRLGRHLTCKRDGQALRSEERSSQQSAETVAWSKKNSSDKEVAETIVAGETRLLYNGLTQLKHAKNRLKTS